jgi:hypothetical protein
LARPLSADHVAVAQQDLAELPRQGLDLAPAGQPRIGQPDLAQHVVDQQHEQLVAAVHVAVQGGAAGAEAGRQAPDRERVEALAVHQVERFEQDPLERQPVLARAPPRQPFFVGRPPRLAAGRPALGPRHATDRTGSCQPRAGPAVAPGATLASVRVEVRHERTPERDLTR